MVRNVGKKEKKKRKRTAEGTWGVKVENGGQKEKTYSGRKAKFPSIYITFISSLYQISLIKYRCPYLR